MPWQLQDAKNRFSEVVQKANTDGPQVVTVRGKPTAVVISIAEFEKLHDQKPSLAEFLLEGDPWDDEFVELVNARDKSLPREIDF